MEKANNFHSTIKSTAEMSETEITFLETKVNKGVWFNKEPVLDGQTDYKPTRCLWAKQKPFTYSCQPPGVKKCFIKGEAFRRLRTDSSQTTLEENIKKFENSLIERGCPVPIVRKYLSELKFADRKTTLWQSNKSARQKNPLSFVTQYRQYHPALLTLKKIQWENGTLYKTNKDYERSLGSLSSYHIARENPLETY